MFAPDHPVPGEEVVGATEEMLVEVERVHTARMPLTLGDHTQTARDLGAPIRQSSLVPRLHFHSGKNQFGIVMVALLLLGFPGLVPVGNLENWDAGLDTTEWPTEVYFSADEEVHITFPLLTEGVMSIDVEFQFRWLGAIEHGQIADGCGHPWESCTFNDIGPISEQSLEVEWPS